MSWVVIALVSAALMGFVSIIDKTAHGYGRSPLTLPLLMAITQTTIGVVVLVTVGVPEDATLEEISIAVLSGFLFGVGVVTQHWILFSQEVSRTIPITQSAPIFAALIAVPVLNEAISGLQWFGIIATVIGCAVLSLRVKHGSSTGSIFLHRSFYLLMVSSVVFGASNVVGKIALNQLPLFFTHGLRTITLGMVLLVCSFRPLPRADVAKFFSQRSLVLFLVAANDFVVANGAMILLLVALELGPVSLVTALSGTRALFVVIYSTGLAFKWHGALGERTTSGVLTVKILSAIMIVIGVAAIAI